MDDGARVGGLGLQFHIWNEEELRSLMHQEYKSPSAILSALDQLAEFHLPIHVSEITLTSPGGTDEGEALQAQAARSLYRLWFSHPAVESISWWNVADGGAAPGEDSRSGLLTSDLQPKASYHALQDLLRKEWRTHAGGVTDAAGMFRLRGFHGSYRVTAKRGSEEASTNHSIISGATNTFSIRL